MAGSKLGSLLILPLIAGASFAAQERHDGGEEGINKRFEKPDVGAFVERFESESREVYARREAIADAVGLRPGLAVADIGAGTGFFARLFAKRVGPEGKVYAVDIAPAFLEHIAAEAKRLGLEQIHTVRGTQQSSNLPPDSIDAAFLCDTYHHLERPKPMLASIRRALRPGGLLVVVDFDRREGISDAFVLKHIRAPKEVFIQEIEAAGFERLEARGTPNLRENFLARFRKVGPMPTEVPEARPESGPGP